mmetsp:Transcript_22910/g.51826  ORF Transcript_22910/g.51826 Transcript_22910/m.51826 type:complete len:200 (-) Transcript_22910:400-999(-)
MVCAAHHHLVSLPLHEENRQAPALLLFGIRPIKNRREGMVDWLSKLDATGMAMQPQFNRQLIAQLHNILTEHTRLRHQLKTKKPAVIRPKRQTGTKCRILLLVLCFGHWSCGIRDHQHHFVVQYILMSAVRHDQPKDVATSPKCGVNDPWSRRRTAAQAVNLGSGMKNLSQKRRRVHRRQINLRLGQSLSRLIVHDLGL